MNFPIQKPFLTIRIKLFAGQFCIYISKIKISFGISSSVIIAQTQILLQNVEKYLCSGCDHARTNTQTYFNFRRHICRVDR